MNPVRLARSCRLPAAMSGSVLLFVLAACTKDASSLTQSTAGGQTLQTAGDGAPREILEDSWPRVFTAGGDQITVYPPSFQSWSGSTATGTCPFSKSAADGSSRAFGTLAFTATTEVNRLNRMVSLTGTRITGVSLPDDPAGQAALQQEIQAQSGAAVLRISLDRFEAMVPAMASGPAVAAPALANDPPALSIATVPTVLVPIQGEPVLQPLPGTDLERVANASMLLLKSPSGSWWLRVADGWMTAASLEGPFSVGTAQDDGLAKAFTWALSQPGINLLAPAAGAGGDDSTSQTVSLSTLAPRIVVSTKPAEVLVVDGSPQWKELGGSGLLYVANTSANIFQLQANGAIYVLVSGRWFTASSTRGPWSHVPPQALPAAFMTIPAESPKENVLASIPGTAQAQEATIANAVPQMARVPLSETLPKPEPIGGKPVLEPIAGTGVSVVANCATPVFLVGTNAWYAVEKGVWFEAGSIEGPWKVATSVPEGIYAIPPSSPWYYVTFVRVYGTGPGYALVGYTPGYFGAYAQDGVVVYGTGYAYAPWCSTVWVPAPVTYGCGAGLVYNPWSGWAMGFGMGMAVGWAIGASTWHCGYYPCWGPYGAAYGPHGAYAWGPGGWAATTGNVYQHWGDVSTMSRTSGGYNAWTGNRWGTQTGTAYNSATGARAAGQRGAVENAYTGKWAAGERGAAANPTTGRYAAGERFATGGPGETTATGGAGTIGNADTGRSASVAGVRTDSGSWGAAHGSQGTAVDADGTLYATHDGNVYRSDGSGGWEQHSSGGSWSQVGDTATRDSLDQQQAGRADGDWRSAMSSRWQPGGDGFAGGDRSWGGSWDDSNWNRGGASGGNAGSGRWGRAGGVGGGGFRGFGGFRR